MDNHAVVIADSSGTIRLWNHGAERLFGYSPIEAIGKSLDLIVPSEFREQHWNGFHRAMETGSANAENQPCELPIACRSGLTAAPAVFTLLRSAQKSVIGAMVVFTISEGTAAR